MATIKSQEDSYHTIHDITLDIHWEKTHYPEDDPQYECSVTFPVPHLPGETVKVDYDTESSSEIEQQIAQDIADYLDDPQAWTENLIKKGVGPVLTLRQLESELAEARADQERYSMYTAQETEKAKRVEQQIAAHKAKHGL
jgi:hypothetical protein